MNRLEALFAALVLLHLGLLVLAIGPRDAGVHPKPDDARTPLAHEASAVSSSSSSSRAAARSNSSPATPTRPLRPMPETTKYAL